MIRPRFNDPVRNGVQVAKESARVPGALEFFAGVGLASEGYKSYFNTVWANDFCSKKGKTYQLNHRGIDFSDKSITDVCGSGLPEATLSWASFPCQDLSLAGNLKGLKGSRSSLVMEWLRVMDEMPTAPKLLVAENVVGLVSAGGGENYLRLHEQLTKRGFKVGAVVLDAKWWTPQSRPRVFVVAVSKEIPTERFESEKFEWCHTKAIQAISNRIPGFRLWKIPKPRTNRKFLEDVIDFSLKCDSSEQSDRLIELIPPKHKERLLKEFSEGRKAFPGYRRTRNGRQVLELRFDGLAGCLRTPAGGSSRQYLVINRKGRMGTRLLAVSEAAQLMGVRKSFKIQGTYNDGYKAMGDAVAVPAVRHLSRHLLAPLSRFAI